MDGASGLTAFASVITSTVKVAEKIFEITAVDEQARAVLQTVNQVSGQLQNARTLRRQKSFILTPFEKRMIDDTFLHTDEAVQQVAKLAERARADMDVSGGRVRVGTRLLFVLRDSPNIHVSLTKLGIASQSLNMAMFMLCSREGRQSNFSGPDTQPEKKGPPTYDESQFLSAGRRKNMERKSAMSLNERFRSTSMTSNSPLPPGNYRSHSDSIIPPHPLHLDDDRPRFNSIGPHFPPQSDYMGGKGASLTPESDRSRSNTISSQTTLAPEDSQSPSVSMPAQYPFPSANILELTAISTFSKLDKDVPNIMVEEHSPAIADIDLDAFSMATSFSPPPTPGQRTRMWSASPTQESEEEFPGFSKPTGNLTYPVPQQRSRSYSGMESLIAREQVFNSNNKPPPAPPRQTPPAWDDFTGSETYHPDNEPFPQFSGSWAEPISQQRPRSWSERAPSPTPPPVADGYPQCGHAAPSMAPPQPRPPDWSGGSLSRVETYPRPYSQAGTYPAPSSPPQQSMTGRARNQRWLEARSQ